jgi:hypothetical protein
MSPTCLRTGLRTTSLLRLHSLCYLFDHCNDILTPLLSSSSSLIVLVFPPYTLYKLYARRYASEVRASRSPPASLWATACRGCAPGPPLSRRLAPPYIVLRNK